MTDSSNPQARLYRMVMGHHICPFGLKAKSLLQGKGYAVQDMPLKNREAVDAFKAEHDVATTPQIFIGAERIGGYTDLRKHFGLHVRDPKQKTYTPVLAVFAVALLMALAAGYVTPAGVLSIRAAEWFIAFSMCLLAMLKLRDVEAFSSMFIGYDLLARRWVRYAYIYPFAELFAGLLMIMGVFVWLSAPIALVIGGIGAVSVIKAVYIDKRDLKCACVGGDSNVPLGFLSLTENIMMMAMAVWMLLKPHLGL
ncbi:MAG: MauE/DoxX family redox-associated membrane protein [Pseudomonadota bacterium]